MKMKKLAASHPIDLCQQPGIHARQREVAAYPRDMLAYHLQSMILFEDLLTQTIPTGPAGIEKDRVEAIDGRRPMMLKATAKIWTVE
jgi:hypothetical protein